MSERIEIDKNAELVPGDVIEMHFRRLSLGIITDAAGYLIEKKIRSNPMYELISWRFTDSEAIYTIKIKQVDTPTYLAGVSPNLIAVGIISLAGGCLAWMSLKVVYKIVDSPAFKFGFTAIAAVAAVLTILVIINQSKK